MFTVIAHNKQALSEHEDAMHASFAAAGFPGAHVKVFTAAERKPHATDAVACMAVLRDAVTDYMYVVKHGSKDTDRVLNFLQAAIDDADEIIQQFP